MRTRMIRSAVMVWAVCFALALGASASSAKTYEFMQTDRNVAWFNNLSETAFTGLRVVFTDEVLPSQAIGLGAVLELVSNEAGVLVYQGTIPPYGVWEIDWALDGPRVHAASWIGADGTEVPIDVHSPHARMWYQIPPGTDDPDDGCISYVPIDIEFKAGWSYDPDGLPLVRHQWSWSDGLALEGETVDRTFWRPGWYTVILTAWDLEGLSHSASETFYIYRCLCEEAEQ